MQMERLSRSRLWSRFPGVRLAALLLAGVTGCGPSEEAPSREAAPESRSPRVA